MNSVAARRPPRLELAKPTPRLIANSAPGASPDAQVWRAQTELILNAAGEGIYGLDLDGCCTFVNPAAAQMTGHSVDELLGQPMHDVVHHSHADHSAYPRGECPIYAAFADGMIRNVVDEVFWRKDGSCFPVDYTSTPIYNGRQLVGAVVVFRDITLRRQTEDRLRNALSEVQHLKERLLRENSSLRQEIESARGLREIVGDSAVLQEMMRLVTRFSQTDSTVLIQGETGTGKELVARSIHSMSARRGGPLVRVNCASLTGQLADSELFGHEKGAFTGAVGRRSGRFEQAHGGTLFLDEVGELSLETQGKLLRVLQERQFERVGGNETMTVDARVISATNRDLKELVGQGRFRADLYFRLNVVPIYVPPLRDRVADIPALAERFLRQLEVRLGRSLGPLSRAGVARLSQYHWPGNVRELQNVIERAAIMSDDREVDVPEELLAFRGVAGGGLSVPQQAPPSRPVDSALFVESPASEPPPSSAPQDLPTLDEVERQHIMQVLEKTRWRLSGPSGASSVLGLHPNTLRHRMKKLGIHR